MDEMYVPSHDFFLLQKLNLQQFALLEEGAGDDVADIVVDSVEADLSVNNRRNRLNYYITWKLYRWTYLYSGESMSVILFL